MIAASSPISGSRTLRLVGLSALLGVLGAFGARVFLWAIAKAGELLLDGIGGYHVPSESHGIPAMTGRYGLALIPVSTALGGLLAGWLVYTWAPEAEGHGTDAAVRAFHRLGGAVRRRVPVIKTLASAITIGSGGSAGREGPTAQISAGIGSMLGSALRLPVGERRLLLLMGIAAGVSAAFRSPLGAALFAVEVLYSEIDFEVEALVYTVIAAAVAYGVNGFFAGWKPLFTLPHGLAFHRGADLPWYAALGVASGIIALVLPEVFYRTEAAFKRLPIPLLLRPALGGLIVGLIAIALPQTLGSGYVWMQQALDGHMAIWLLVVLAFAKIVTLSLTIGSGGSGGVFAPALFVGCMLGAAMGQFSSQWLEPGLRADHVTSMAVVGMAALFSGAGRVPLATLIMAAELTGGYGLIVPTMVAVALAYLVESSLTRRLRAPHGLLFHSQVPTRADSPVHQAELLSSALDILRTDASGENLLLEWPRLEQLLAWGSPIAIGTGGDFLVTARVRPDAAGSLIGSFTWFGETMPVAVVRAGGALRPQAQLVLQADDLVVLAVQPAQVGSFASELALLTTLPGATPAEVSARPPAGMS